MDRDEWSVREEERKRREMERCATKRSRVEVSALHGAVGWDVCVHGQIPTVGPLRPILSPLRVKLTLRMLRL